jgi:hypothetical protein
MTDPKYGNWKTVLLALFIGFSTYIIWKIFILDGLHPLLGG